MAAVALVVGVAVAFVTARTIVTVTRMSAWPTVPATLERVDLRLASGATSRARSVAARYHYAIDGQTFTGTQVSVYAPDSLGSFFDRTYADLRGHLDRHEPVPVHVNPASPSDAVLLPVWRPEVLAFDAVMMLVFGGSGLALLSGRIGSWRLQRQRPEKIRRESATGDSTLTADTTSPDTNDRLPAAAAWARRWLLLGILTMAVAFVLLDGSRGDSYSFLDRLLATQVVATGTIGAAGAPTGAVESAFERARRALGDDAQLTLEEQRPQGSTFRLSVTAASRDQALARVDEFLAATGQEYRAQSGRDLDTFRNAYVAPLPTPELLRLRTAIVGGLLLAGLACILAWWRLG
jgi:hypothetical protein